LPRYFSRCFVFPVTPLLQDGVDLAAGFAFVSKG
jgi:hypothetical protein